MHLGRHLRAAPECVCLVGGEWKGGKCVATAQSGKGSKRRIRQVRWTRREIISAAFFLLIALVFCVFVGLWVIFHHFD